MSYPKYRAAGIVVGDDWDALVRTVLSYGGATAVVGFNANLTGRENYFLCDGTADDVQIQAAIDYVSALGGGSTFVERGTYEITQTITIPDNITLAGTGSTTLLRSSNGAAGHVIENVDYATGANSNIVIRDLKINARRSVRGGAVRCITAKLIDSEILNCHFEDAWTFVQLEVGTLGSIISECQCDTAADTGLALWDAELTKISNCTVHGCVEAGIEFDGVCVSCVAEGNTVYDCLDGLELDIQGADVPISCAFIGNTIKEVTNNGIAVGYGSLHTITGNTIYDAVQGIRVLDASFCTISHNTVTLTTVGIYSQKWRNIFIGNVIRDTIEHGMQLLADDTVVKGNIVDSVDSSSTNTYSNIYVDGDYCIVEGNLLLDIEAYDMAYGVEVGSNAQYIQVKNNIFSFGGSEWGIHVSTGATRTDVRGNELLRVAWNRRILNEGTDTIFDFEVLNFIGGTTLLSADGSPKGYEIDDVDEWALTCGWTPPNGRRIMNIRVTAVGLVDPGVGNKMLLTLNANGGKSDEQYTAEPVVVTNKGTEEIDFDVNDIITWIFTGSDDVDISHMDDKHSIEIKLKYNAAVAADVATDAVLRNVVIEHI